MTTTVGPGTAPGTHTATCTVTDAGLKGQERTDISERSSTDLLSAADIPWNLVVWNDPVNLMSYVSYVFQSYFGYSEAKSNKLMLEVHKKGRSIVAHGGKEQVEQHAVAMHGYGLWATVEKASSSGDGRGRKGGARG
jgi:ATP-dependent Clp protease adaptor protein ClpS